MANNQASSTSQLLFSELCIFYDIDGCLEIRIFSFYFCFFSLFRSLLCSLFVSVSTFFSSKQLNRSLKEVACSSGSPIFVYGNKGCKIAGLETKLLISPSKTPVLVLLVRVFDRAYTVFLQPIHEQLGPHDMLLAKH